MSFRRANSLRLAVVGVSPQFSTMSELSSAQLDRAHIVRQICTK
jgi:hypothetical protein